jgi:hypothetical protein
MRLCYLVVALTLLAAFASDSWGQSQEPPQAQRVQVEQQPKGARKSDAEAEAEINKSAQLARSIYSSPSSNLNEKTNGDPDQAKIEASEYWTIFGRHLKITDTLLALFTFVLIAVGAWQGIQLKSTVDLAREEFIATHRPKIKLHTAEITRRVPEGDDVNRIGVSILCFNIGESVAKNVEVRGQIFAGSNFAVDVQRPIVKTFPEVLSGQKLRAQIESDYPVVDVASGKRRGVDYHCIGWIAYWDENGLRRETGFCLRAEFTDRDRWVSAGKPEYEYDY